MSTHYGKLVSDDELDSGDVPKIASQYAKLLSDEEIEERANANAVAATDVSQNDTMRDRSKTTDSDSNILLFFCY
jgi:hypothetical protein